METINVFCAECGNLLKAIADEDGSIFVELCEHCAWKYQEEINRLEDEIDRKTARFNVYGYRIW